MHYQTFEISPHFLVSNLGSPKQMELSDIEKKRVNALWKEKQRTGLTNDKLFAFVSFNGQQLIGQSVPYKYYVAQEMDPELKFCIEPICLSGIVRCDGALLVGQRSRSVFQYPGHFEAVPSGGISPCVFKKGHVNIEKEIMRELKEETGLLQAKKIVPLALVHDTTNKLYEICVGLDIEKEHAGQLLTKTNEYEQLCWVAESKLAALLKREKWVPFSLYLIENYLKQL